MTTLNFLSTVQALYELLFAHHTLSLVLFGFVARIVEQPRLTVKAGGSHACLHEVWKHLANKAAHLRNPSDSLSKFRILGCFADNAREVDDKPALGCRMGQAERLEGEVPVVHGSADHQCNAFPRQAMHSCLQLIQSWCLRAAASRRS